MVLHVKSRDVRGPPLPILSEGPPKSKLFKKILSPHPRICSLTLEGEEVGGGERENERERETSV